MEQATKLDEEDELKAFRNEFLFPTQADGKPYLYFVGNSLGLQPKKAKEYVAQEMDDWASLGVRGHLHARKPWLPYHEFLTEPTARLVGAYPDEVVVMNSLTTNLHLMLVSFYRPTKSRYKILIEENAFPSDRYAVASQARFHGLDPRLAVVEWKRGNDFIDSIHDDVALVLIGNVNYLSGEAFDTAELTKLAHSKGCVIGFDFAHGAGNLELKLHDWNVDFAVWCSYKYLNGGPGAIAGCFVHRKHTSAKLPRFEGWWGTEKKTRFQMGPDFIPMQTAESWQLSNPPILQLAALRASMELFDQATMPRLRKKSEKLTAYLEEQLRKIPGAPFEILTPKSRGCQLSLKVQNAAQGIEEKFKAKGVLCDYREPGILRFAPTPLYNSFTDVWRLGQLMGELWNR